MTIGAVTVRRPLKRQRERKKAQEQSNKGKERGVTVGGCHSSVAERWWLKPDALGSIPGGATFLSFPLPFQRSMDSNGPDCLSLDIKSASFGVRTVGESRPSDSPCCDYAHRPL